jgi:hypothetical protein
MFTDLSRSVGVQNSLTLDTGDSVIRNISSELATGIRLREHAKFGTSSRQNTRGILWCEEEGCYKRTQRTGVLGWWRWEDTEEEEDEEEDEEME